MSTIIKHYRGGKLAKFTIDGVPQTKGLGDKIAENPIVKMIGKVTGCVDPETKEVKPDSGCGKMKARLNSGMSVKEAMKLRLQGK